MIYTRNGDAGTTRDFNGVSHENSSKNINANGSVDELNSHIGNVLLNTKSELLENIQHELFVVGSVISGYNNNYNSEVFVKDIEKNIDDILGRVPPIKNFILPKGSITCVNLHMCRTVCRRAERDLCSINRSESVVQCIKLLNRLSDLLFIMAYEQNVKDKNLIIVNKKYEKVFNVMSKFWDIIKYFWYR